MDKAERNSYVRDLLFEVDSYIIENINRINELPLTDIVKNNELIDFDSSDIYEELIEKYSQEEYSDIIESINSLLEELDSAIDDPDCYRSRDANIDLYENLESLLEDCENYNPYYNSSNLLEYISSIFKSFKNNLNRSYSYSYDSYFNEHFEHIVIKKSISHMYGNNEEIILSKEDKARNLNLLI